MNLFNEHIEWTNLLVGGTSLLVAIANPAEELASSTAAPSYRSIE